MLSSFFCVSKNVDDTYELASKFSSLLQPGLFVGLYGELGAGKTEFVRGLLTALGITEQVTSPTFVLEIEYAAPANTGLKYISHWDLYRLTTQELSELSAQKNDLTRATLIEWPNKIKEIEGQLDIEIKIYSPIKDKKIFDFLNIPTEEQARIFVFNAQDADTRRTLGLMLK